MIDLIIDLISEWLCGEPLGCWACRWHKGQAEMQRLGELKPAQLSASGTGKAIDMVATRREGQGQWGCHQRDGVGHARDLQCRVTAAEGP